MNYSNAKNFLSEIQLMSNVTFDGLEETYQKMSHSGKLFFLKQGFDNARKLTDGYKKISKLPTIYKQQGVTFIAIIVEARKCNIDLSPQRLSKDVDLSELQKEFEELEMIVVDAFHNSKLSTFKSIDDYHDFLYRQFEHMYSASPEVFDNIKMILDGHTIYEEES